MWSSSRIYPWAHTSFADDTTIMSSSNDIKGLYDKMNFELGELSKWFKADKLCLNVKKTKYILFGPNRANTVRQCRDLDILIDGKTVHLNSWEYTSMKLSHGDIICKKCVQKYQAQIILSIKSKTFYQNQL